MLAPFVTGSLIEGAATPLAGYHMGFLVSAAMQIGGGLAGLALMWPGADCARIASLRKVGANLMGVHTPA